MVPDGQGQIQVLLRSGTAMGAAVDVGADEEAEELLDPEGVLMRGLYRIKQFPAELLHIVLLEGLRFRPLKTPE